MQNEKDILLMIKNSVRNIEPNATVILYGSYARGDNRDDSDIDLLILLEKDKITWQDEKKIKYPLYNIEFDTGKIISPMVLSKKDWEKRHRITSFYENVQHEGIIL